MYYEITVNRKSDLNSSSAMLHKKKRFSRPKDEFLMAYIHDAFQDERVESVTIERVEPTEVEALEDELTTALWGVDSTSADQMAKALAPIIIKYQKKDS